MRTRPAGMDADPAADAGVEGNGRLTAVNGMVLLVVLALEGVTILSIRQMITLHVYIGLLLVGPVLLKCATTAYRFARYYSRSLPYVQKGPPHVVLRILGPVVLLSSLAVLGTGIGLIFTGPVHREPLLTLHQSAFIVWIAATGVHVLGHIVQAGKATWHELRDPASTPLTRCRRWRTLAVAGALLAGVALATTLTPAAHAWTSVRYQHDGHRDGDAVTYPATLVR